MAELPSTQRLAVELAYVEGCTHSEVGCASGLFLGTAHLRIRDGLLKLCDVMGAR